MKNRIHILLFVFITVCFLLAACTGVSSTNSPEPTTADVISSPASLATPTRVIRTGVWDELLSATPFPHEFPLPASVDSPLDGTYAKVDQSVPQFWTCYRCADYRPMGGIWRLQFDKGVMRVFYQITNWKSIASFTVEGNRLKIFNDPFCPHDVGEYEWSLDNGSLTLNAINDGCAFDLRGENLVKQTWSVCDADASTAECAEPPMAPIGETASALPVTVTVLGGDSHIFSKPPELFAAANPEDVASPEGIKIQYANESIGYGTHRVLWKNGDWMEATTELPFTSIGVQLWGSGYLGWARVLFDDVEVWRGLTTSLGKKHAYYGGYIEVTGFEPGAHTIRVESLSFDYRPIKVAAFGFSNQQTEK